MDRNNDHLINSNNQSLDAKVNNTNNFNKMNNVIDMRPKIELSNMNNKEKESNIVVHNNNNINNSAIKVETDNLDEDKTFLDPLDMPGNLEKAKKHLRACQIFDYGKLPDNVDLCDDCLCPIPEENHTPRFSCCVNSKKLAPFGLGLYLYFFYIRFIVWVLIIMFSMVAVPQIYFARSYQNDLENHCLNSNLEEDIVCRNYTYVLDDNDEEKNRSLDFLWSMNFETFDFNERIIHSDNLGDIDPTIDMNLLHFLCEITLVIVNAIFMLTAFNLDLEADLENITPKDFTLRISNISTNLNESEIKEELEIEKIKIYEVNRTFKLHDFFECKDKYIQCRKKIAYLNAKNKTEISSCWNKTTKQQLKQELKEYDDRMTVLLEEINNGKTYMTDSVYVVFENTIDKIEYQKLFPTALLDFIFLYIKLFFCYLFKCCVKQSTIDNIKRRTQYRCHKAEEPTDIIWENVEYTEGNRFLRTFIIYSITVLMLFVSFWILFAINIAQRDMEDYSNNWKYAISIGFATALAILNFIINIVLEILTKFEKNISYSSYYLSYSYKLMIATFCNTALLPIAVAYFTSTWENKGILINNAFIFFLTNAFVTPVLFFIDISYILKIGNRWLLNKKYGINKEPMLHTQQELNSVFENPDMSLAQKYAFLGKTILMTILYIPLLPIGIIISLSGIILFYFIEKWNLTQRYKIPPKVDSEITFGYLYSFRLFLFVYAISVYVFLSDVYQSYFKFALFSIILYGVLVIIPYVRIFTCDLLKVVTKDFYEEEYFNFTTKYETQNPITKTSAYHKLLEKMKEQNIVTDEEYSDYARRLSEGEFVDLMEIYKIKKGKFQKFDLADLKKKKDTIRTLKKDKSLLDAQGNKNININLIKDIVNNKNLNKFVNMNNSVSNNNINRNVNMSRGNDYSVGLDHNNNKEDLLTIKQN